MTRYFFLQCKRSLRAVPGLLCVVLVLLGGFLGVLGAMTARQDQSNTKFRIAICGTAQDTFLELGLAALQTFDSTRFSMEVESMTEPDASQALARGEIAAYVAIPEGFAEAAAYGRIMPLKYVSTPGAQGMVSLVKDEVTTVVTDLVMESMRCTYGMGNAAEDQNLSGVGTLMGDMAIEYTQFLFLRGNTYAVTTLGVSDGLGMGQYLLSGLTVLFLLLACLPFGPLLIRRDLSLQQMLMPKGVTAWKQTVCEFLSYLGVYLTVLAATAAVLLPWLPEGFSPMAVLPGAVMAAALSFLLYSLAKDLISGVLLQFLVTAALSFISGCMYPISFFPEPVQALAGVLPTGMARQLIAQGFAGAVSAGAVWTLLGCSALFLVLAALTRKRALSGR